MAYPFLQYHQTITFTQSTYKLSAQLSLYHQSIQHISESECFNKTKGLLKEEYKILVTEHINGYSEEWNY